MISRWIGASAVLALFLATAGCQGDTGPAGPAGSTGAKGDPGGAGPAGKDGLPGKDGAAGAQGDKGADGAPGKDGAEGAPGKDGAEGAPGKDGAEGAPGKDGKNGLNAGEFPLAVEPTGVVGRVLDTAGLPLKDAKVYLVPAKAIKTDKLVIDSPEPAKLAIADVAADKADEPLEDLIDAQATTPTFQVGTTNGDGVYAIPSVADGSFFIFVLPAPADTDRLPGGSHARKALSAKDDLTGKRVDIAVSMSIPKDAMYVGSSACMACHGTQHIKSTLHFLGIRQPGKNDGLQKLDWAKWPNFDDCLALFDGSTTIYYYSSNPGAAVPGYATYLVKQGEAQPDQAWLDAKTPSFKIVLGKATSGALQATISNLKATEDAKTYDVQLSYGGGLYKQRFVVEIGGLRHVLPIQYNHQGTHDNSSATPGSRRLVIGYNTDRWYDETGKKLKVPAVGKAFDNNCIGCHAAGVQSVPVAGVTGAWKAIPIPDPNAKYDFDKDGVEDQLNIGCETCHGPGSKHMEHQGKGWYIVSPGLLPPEREALICGQCHSRANGTGIGKTEAPTDVNGLMMIPGIRRSEWIKSYVSKIDDGIWVTTKSPDGTYNTAIGDDKHASKHHQQYSDFLKSKHYRNGTFLATCTGCHDPHGSPNAKQLKAPTDTALCTSCHKDVAIGAHTKAKVGFDKSGLDIGCADCHLTKTAQSGAGVPGLKDSGLWTNDISSHIFDVPSKQLLKGVDPKAANGPKDKVMPVPYGNACGSGCHKLPVQ